MNSVPPGLELLDGPRPEPGPLDGSELQGRVGDAVVVAQLGREAGGCPIGLLCAIEVDVAGKRRERLPSELRSRSCPSSKQAASSADLSPRSAARLRTRRARSAASLLAGKAQRARSADHDLELEVRVPHGFGRCRKLGQTLEAVTRPADHRIGVVAGHQQIATVLWGRDDGSACSMTRSASSGAFDGAQPGRPRSRSERRAGCHRRRRMPRQHRKARRWRLSLTGQQVDDRRVDLPAPRVTERSEAIRGPVRG